jgi:2-polyprenyl-3-methyl-5-hydroxy-6-metoxy-1,4-benzoquinol methylase
MTVKRREEGMKRHKYKDFGHSAAELPVSVPCSWNDRSLSLRWILPTIWTVGSGRTFGIYWSDELRYGALHPEPTEDELAEFYQIESYDEYLGGTGRQSASNPNLFSRVVVKLAYLADRGINNPIPSILRTSGGQRLSVCDIGCGSGSFLNTIKSHCAYVVGIDPSEVSGSAVRARGIEFYPGTAEQLPAAVATRRFDVVSMFQSLEHCRDPRLSIMNAKGLVKSGGLIVVDVPNMDCLGFKFYRQAWYHTDAGRHLHFFSLRSLSALFRSAGLVPFKVEYCGFTGQFTPGWISAMGEVWDNLFAQSPAVSTPPRPSLARSTLYLAVALLATHRLKYDVVRVYARSGDSSSPDGASS